MLLLVDFRCSECFWSEMCAHRGSKCVFGSWLRTCLVSHSTTSNGTVQELRDRVRSTNVQHEELSAQQWASDCTQSTPADWSSGCFLASSLLGCAVSCCSFLSSYGTYCRHFGLLSGLVGVLALGSGRWAATPFHRDTLDRRGSLALPAPPTISPACRVHSLISAKLH